MLLWGGLGPPLRSAECQHCAMQTRLETRAVLSVFRCLCRLPYQHHHRWMQLHISSHVRSSSSIELRQVIQRSGCYLIYGQLRTHGVGLKVVENLFTLSCLTSTSSPTSTLVYLAHLLSSACIFDSPFSSASLSRTSKSSRYSSVKSGSFPLNFRL